MTGQEVTHLQARARKAQGRQEGWVLVLAVPFCSERLWTDAGHLWAPLLHLLDGGRCVRSAKSLKLSGRGGGLRLDCPDLLRLSWEPGETDSFPLFSTPLGVAGAQWSKHPVICPCLPLRSALGSMQLSCQLLFHRPALPAMAMIEPSTLAHLVFDLGDEWSPDLNTD